MKPLLWYLFDQNNSGGSFEGNDDLSEIVFIQARSPNQANRIAEQKGIYFDGVERGLDCECCGNRWGRADEGYPQPRLYETDFNWNGEKRATISTGNYSYEATFHPFVEEDE